MMKSAFILFMLLLILPFDGRAQAANEEELTLSPQQKMPPISVQLTEDEQHWLNTQNALRIGIYPQRLPSIVQTIFLDQYSGVNAGYLSIIQQALNKKITLINYQNRDKALQALHNGEINTVLTGAEYQPNVHDELMSSTPVTYSWPSLMANITNTLSPLSTLKDVRVGTVGNYPDDEFIYSSFPNAKIHRYNNYEAVLDALSTGKDDYFIGDSLNSSLWLSQEYRNNIVTLKYWATPQKNSLFLFTKDQSLLQAIINNVLKNINNTIHSQLSYSSIDNNDLAFLIEPIDFTASEKNWLKHNKKIRVLVNPWTIPFTMVDDEKNIRGISGDILNLISLQTGLVFEPVIVHSLAEIEEELSKDEWSMLVPAAYNTKINKSLLYTIPFINTQFVSVVKKENFTNATLEPGMRVSLADDNPIMSELIEKYPGVKWIRVNNVSIALNLVAENKVDAAVSNRLATRYFSEHFYPDEFIWQDIPDVIPASFRLAISPHDPELKSILDKAKDRIPQREMFQIVSKWLRLPEARIETWELYNKQFYLVAILAAAFVLSTTLWAIYLVKEVRKRKRSQRLLIQEKNKAQRASKENREFLSRMSHELRTPVSAIVGYLELLQNRTINFKPEDKLYINQATEASHTLLNLIGDILDLEKIESGIIDVMPTWGTIDHLINTKIILFKALANKKGLTIKYNSTIDHHQTVRVDYQLLGQVLNNIIGNALKFTHQGGINISASLENHVLVLNITDTGPGIPADLQSRLFEPFIQAGHHSTEQGTGLGLTICKVLMNKMQGSLHLKSEVNIGTTLILTLPVETQWDEKYQPPQPTMIAQVVNKNLQILIADDQPTSRLLLQRQLAILGLKSDQAADGQAALAMLKQTSYDILITDVNMPIIDGIALTKTIRESNNHITIFGLTATAQLHERERCLDAGMNDCLFKPINLEQLTLMISEVQKEDTLLFNMDRLTVLAQGNRILMLNALNDAQQGNYNDFLLAQQALMKSDYQACQYHIHRIRGTALLLGYNELAAQTQRLEETLLNEEGSTASLLTMLEDIHCLLVSLDNAIKKFKP